MKRTLIIGHSGQDGRILWDQLAKRGDTIVGLSSSTSRYHPLPARGGATVNTCTIESVIHDLRPDEVYYLAACHHSSQDNLVDSAQLWQKSWATHVQGFKNVLAALKHSAPRAKVFYASSSRIFGTNPSSPQNEDTPWAPVCIYGTTKAAGMLVANYYRRALEMHVSCGILYNHESEIRGVQFLSQRVVHGLVSIKQGKSKVLELGSLDARVDWGYAPDYTRAMSLMLERDAPGDLIVATGITHSVRDWVTMAAAILDLDWQQVVREKKEILQRQPQSLCGDASQLSIQTGWRPSIDFEEMVKIMVGAALLRG